MYTPEMLESIKKLEASREARMATEQQARDEQMRAAAEQRAADQKARIDASLEASRNAGKRN